jgi:hypothetical protein
MALRPTAWEPLIEHHQGRMMMMPLLLLNGEAELDGGPAGAVDGDQFLAEVPDIIPACLAGIYQFWKYHRTNPKLQPS